MSGVQSPEQRTAELLRLRDAIDAELVRLNPSPDRRRPRNVQPLCGSESAYQRHRWYGEPQDDACKAAHALHERLAAIKRGITRKTGAA